MEKNQDNFLYFCIKNICCDLSSGLSQEDGSDEGSQYIVSNSPVIIKFSFLSRALSNFFLGFPSGLLNEGPRDSLCGVKGSLTMIQCMLF